MSSGEQGSPPKVWFITGSSRGLGRAFAEAALGRGDLVAATARDRRSLDHLGTRYGDSVLTLALDVADRTSCFRAVDAAREHFGRLDIVVNNAGYGLFGAVEEVSEEEARRQFDVNVFGALWVTQAALEVMRAAQDGRIIQISSVGGLVAIPGVGIYNASKWALEGFSEALAKEVAPLGIDVVIVEPGPYATEWGTSSKIETSNPMAAYDRLREPGPEPDAGDTAAAGAAILFLADAPDPPLRILFGRGAGAWVRGVYERRMRGWDEWSALSSAAHGVRQR